ncbi:MAG: hypothetical protein CML67_03940 [Rhodobacteraceae bacterium]|nr:hypothetical protein [Paracoccaceae bacterium]
MGLGAMAVAAGAARAASQAEPEPRAPQEAPAVMAARGARMEWSSPPRQWLQGPGRAKTAAMGPMAVRVARASAPEAVAAVAVARVVMALP